MFNPRFTLRALAALALVAAGLAGADTPIPPALKPGATFPDFKIVDLSGKEHTLADYKGKILVFVFTTPECPCSRSVDRHLSELATTYADKNVVFLGVNANFLTDPEALAEYAKQVGVHFTILKDDYQELADATGARVTPEVFIVDTDGKVVFHGPPDNRPTPTAKPTVFYLQDALAALTTGKPIPVTDVTPWGCFIRGHEPGTADDSHTDEKEKKSP